jgi:hypothetical protein
MPKQSPNSRQDTRLSERRCNEIGSTEFQQGSNLIGGKILRGNDHWNGDAVWKSAGTLNFFKSALIR